MMAARRDNVAAEFAWQLFSVMRRWRVIFGQVGRWRRDRDDGDLWCPRCPWQTVPLWYLSSIPWSSRRRRAVAPSRVCSSSRNLLRICALRFCTHANEIFFPTLSVTVSFVLTRVKLCQLCVCTQESLLLVLWRHKWRLGRVRMRRIKSIRYIQLAGKAARRILANSYGWRAEPTERSRSCDLRRLGAPITRRHGTWAQERGRGSEREGEGRQALSERGREMHGRDTRVRCSWWVARWRAMGRQESRRGNVTR